MLGAAAAAQSALPPNPSGPSPGYSSRQYLFGDWGGKRSALAEKGITFDFFYISDMQANPSGGIQSDLCRMGTNSRNGRHQFRQDDPVAGAWLSRDGALAIGSQPGRQDRDSRQPERFGESTQYALGFLLGAAALSPQ